MNDFGQLGQPRKSHYPETDGELIKGEHSSEAMDITEGFRQRCPIISTSFKLHITGLEPKQEYEETEKSVAMTSARGELTNLKVYSSALRSRSWSSERSRDTRKENPHV